MSLLKVDALTFYYSRKKIKQNRVVKEVSFAAEAGESVFLLGENGAGKTTLFRCILGLLTPQQGQVFTSGVPNSKLSAKELSKQMAYIPQAHAPTFNYTVLEIVLMGTSVHVSALATPGKKEVQLALEALRTLGIEFLAYRGYAKLSGGERQLVLIARALAQQSKILVMDEPTANLDFGNQHRVLRTIKELTASGYLVLLSTHNPDHALLYGDRVLVMGRGRLLHQGSPAVVLTPEVLGDLYKLPVEMPMITVNGRRLPVVIPRIE